MKWLEMDKIQKISQVQRLASRGFSATEIALHFEGASRSAVIGLASRNKIVLRGGNSTKSSKVVAANDSAHKPKAQAQRPAAKAKKSPAKVTRIVKPAKKTDSVPVATTKVCEVLEFKAPERKPVMLLDLKNTSCRWPMFFDAKGLRDEELLFCGCRREEGSSYCSKHRKITSDGFVRMKPLADSQPRPTHKRKIFIRGVT